ncbi:MAG: hypothetical protein K1X89_03695 [Myxococcaceae bacterium]|nr:hypothetical protein [Myxococcaceae bacterium]
MAPPPLLPSTLKVELTRFDGDRPREAPIDGLARSGRWWWLTLALGAPALFLVGVFLSSWLGLRLGR